MRRVDLPEIEDQSWCPGWLLDALTGYLQVAIEQGRPYDVALPALDALLSATRATSVIDLGSGAGGPWPDLFPELRTRHPGLTLTLTDLAPNAGAVERFAGVEGVTYSPEGVSALAGPARPGEVRTMFTALHHFSPEEVKAILLSAQRERIGFAAFEATHRSAAGLLVTVLVPLLAMVLMPRVRPRSWIALLITYLPPVVPLVIWWDGVASTLRTYSVAEMQAIAAEIAEPGYLWQVEEVRAPRVPVPILQVIGSPGATAS